MFYRCVHGPEYCRTDLQQLSHYRETPSTPVRSVPQLHRLQEGVWQSLACRPLAGPQKLQHRGRISSSHSGTIWELQHSSPLEQSARGVLKTTISVRRLLSPILFNLVLEKIMQETLHEHHTSISIGERPIRKLQFADDIDLMGGSKGELQDVTNGLVDRAAAFGMKATQKRARSWPTARITSVQILMWTVES